MGKAIVYCGDCGRSLHEEDFEKGRAHILESGPYCTACRPRPAGGALPQGSSTRIQLVSPGPAAAKPPSTTRLPKPPAATRRAAAPAGRGVPKGFLGGAAFAAVVLAALAAFLAAGGDRAPEMPSSPGPKALPGKGAGGGTVGAGVPARDPEAEKVEREMRAQRERDEAARLDQFLGQIRGVLGDVPYLPRRREEVEGMLAAAGRIAGARQAEVEALRAEFARKLQEAAFEALLPPIREMAGDTSALLGKRAEVERLLAEAEKAAGARRPEVDALRAEIARKIEEATRSWSASIGFEAGFEKELLRVDDWKGLKYTEDPKNVHGGRRAVHISPGGVGAAFVIKGLREGPTYVMSCWARKGAGGDEGYVGFEFWGDKKRLTKHGFKIESSDYRKVTHELKAPRGTTTLMFWIWSDEKGEYFVDDVEVVLKQP